MIIFSVDIVPMAQPRPKARRIGLGIQIYTPQNTKVKDYKAAIVAAFREDAGLDFVPLEGALEVTVAFLMGRTPDVMSDDIVYHIKKPDLDNMAKAVLDALNGIAWKDDSQIASLVLSKKYDNIYLGGKSGRKKMAVSPKMIIAIDKLTN